jgi:hypothetical protein
VRLWLVVVAIAALGATASAHQSSIKYIELAIAGDRADVAFKVAPGDVAEPMGLAADAKPTAVQAAAAAGVPAYVQRWLAIRAGELACVAGPARARADEDGFVIVAWSVTCPRVLDRVTLDLGAFFALDKRMEAIVRLARAGSDEVTPVVVRAGDSPITLRTGETSLFGWLRAGLHHVFGGADHVSFVLALLLVVMLERDASAWRVKAIAPSLRSTAGVITAFTLAHSLTLALAALGWIALPMRLVGSLVAATIVYTAAEDILRPPTGAASRWRFGLAFGFGLAHGLGFAGTLAVDLPPEQALAPLVCFNVGIELAQLAIIAIALPIFYAAARTLGPDRYRRVAMPAFCSVILLVGTVWLIQRAFDM